MRASASTDGSVAARGELEAADRPAGKEADDDGDHRGDETAERPAEDGDNAMLFARRPAAPHQERDHRDGAQAAEDPRSGGEQAVDQPLALGEGFGRREPHAVTLTE